VAVLLLYRGLSFLYFVIWGKIGQQYQARFEKMVADTSGFGWGFHDQLTYLYEKYFSTKGRDVGEQKIL